MPDRSRQMTPDKTKRFAGIARMVCGLLVAVCVMTGCRQSPIFSHFEPVSSAEWDKEDAIQLPTVALPSDGEYEEELGVCISSEYPFTDLSVIVEHKCYPTHESWSDTVYCRLIDDEGNALGSGISQYQNVFPVRRRQFYEGDSLAILIRHNMKRETLPGILSVGLAITPTAARQD